MKPELIKICRFSIINFSEKSLLELVDMELEPVVNPRTTPENATSILIDLRDDKFILLGDKDKSILYDPEILNENYIDEPLEDIARIP